MVIHICELFNPHKDAAYPAHKGQGFRRMFSMKHLLKNPTLMMAATFFASILAGTLLLLLPASTTHGISILDALFTATSATCVTGLTVQDTGSCFTLFGMTVIMCLMEIGGLGILTFSAFFVGLFTGHLGFAERSWLGDSLTQRYISDFYPFVRKVILWLFLLQFVGALLLLCQFSRQFSLGWSLFLSIFHSISAFCNAGFSPFSDSLEQYRGNFYVNFVVMALIVAGGIGFTVLDDIVNRLRGRRKTLSLHSRIVLCTSAFLIVGGFLIIWLAEYQRSFAAFSAGEKFLGALFQSVDMRTAGFNTVPVAALSEASLFCVVFLMVVGGSPGSAAGGIKTSSLAIFICLIFSRLRGRTRPELFERTVSGETIERMVTLMLASFIMIATGVFALLCTEGSSAYFQNNRNPFLAVVFEVVSAIGTVGASMGITPYLTPAGKLIIIVLMFVGRIGPLGLAIFMMERKEKLEYMYPEEDVMIG
jgi:trk system potassium uptake protein TrkH